LSIPARVSIKISLDKLARKSWLQLPGAPAGESEGGYSDKGAWGKIVDPGPSWSAIFAWMEPENRKRPVVGNFHAGLTGRRRAPSKPPTINFPFSRPWVGAGVDRF